MTNYFNFIDNSNIIYDIYISEDSITIRARIEPGIKYLRLSSYNKDKTLIETFGPRELTDFVIRLLKNKAFW